MEKMQKVRIIRKNDADSLEYEVGDILDVEGTWYGGVNVKGRSGIPLSLDREEYEEYRQEPQNAAGQEEQSIGKAVQPLSGECRQGTEQRFPGHPRLQGGPPHNRVPSSSMTRLPAVTSPHTSQSLLENRRGKT